MPRRRTRTWSPTFGRAGLKPGQYVWASSIPTTGDTRVVIDRLT